MCTNTGERIIGKQGILLGMDNDPWLDVDLMADIISFAELVQQYRVTYNTDIKDSFYCHTQSGIVKFERTEEGLYSISLPAGYKDEVQTQNNNKTGYSHVTTVTENSRNYTTVEFGRAKMARKLYHILGAPSTSNYKKILWGNMIKD